MAKKMTLNNLKSQVKKEFTHKKILIDGYEVIIETKFKPSKVQQLIYELLEKMEYAEKNGVVINLVDYVYILILKHFTSIKFSHEYEKQVQMMEVLVDLNYLERLLSEFNQDEVDKIVNIFKNNVNNLSELLKQQDVIKNAEL